MAALIPWALQALQLALFACVKPLFMALISSIINPKFLLQCFLQMAEKIAEHTATDFDDKMVAQLKESMQSDLAKYSPESLNSKDHQS